MVIERTAARPRFPYLLTGLLCAIAGAAILGLVRIQSLLARVDTLSGTVESLSVQVERMSGQLEQVNQSLAEKAAAPVKAAPAATPSPVAPKADSKPESKPAPAKHGPVQALTAPQKPQKDGAKSTPAKAKPAASSGHDSPHQAKEDTVLDKVGNKVVKVMGKGTAPEVGPAPVAGGN